MKKLRVGILILIVLILGILPVVAAENGKIAFVSGRDGNLEIYLMNADGTEQTRMTSNSVYDGEPAWSPDGKKIVYVSARDGNNELYIMNADGTEQTRITTNTADDIEPAWSPDGLKIAFASNRNGEYSIFLMIPDGTNQYSLVNGHHPAWSSDGSKIAFVSTRDGNDEIYIMNADGTSQTRVTTLSSSILHPVWSPDGKITFETNVDGTWTWDIYNINSDGTGLSRLTLESDGEPAWSPDGTKIVFQSWRNNAIPQIYIMNPDGTGQTRITFTQVLDSHPAWGPVPNRPPIAIADNYAVYKNTVLKVPPNGVLTNDYDPDGDILTAMIVTSPIHGKVLFKNDGSFTFTPVKGYTGIDSFSYEASDGIASSIATVTITVKELPKKPK